MQLREFAADSSNSLVTTHSREIRERRSNTRPRLIDHGAALIRRNRAKHLGPVSTTARKEALE